MIGIRSIRPNGAVAATAALLGATMLLATSPTLAATTTASMPVSATVSATCTISASSFNAGTYTGASSVATSGSPLSVTCTNGTTYNVGLDAGAGAGATTTTRKMTNGSSTLNYAIYTSSARSTVWGNTVGTDTVSGTGTGTAQALAVFFTIPSGQTPIAGAFNDTVTATLTY